MPAHARPTFARLLSASCLAAVLGISGSLGASGCFALPIHRSNDRMLVGAGGTAMIADDAGTILRWASATTLEVVQNQLGCEAITPGRPLRIAGQPR